MTTRKKRSKTLTCKAINSKGKRCEKKPLEGGQYCFRHSLTRLKDIPFWMQPLFHVILIALTCGIIFGLPLLQEKLGHTVGIQPPGPRGDEAIQVEMQNTLQSVQSYLDETYHTGHVVMGMSKRTGFRWADLEDSGGLGSFPDYLRVHWETGEVIGVTSQRVQLRLPDLTDLRTNHITIGPLLSIRKEKGERVPVWQQSDFAIELEILEVYNDFVTFSLGIVRD